MPDEGRAFLVNASALLGLLTEYSDHFTNLLTDLSVHPCASSLSCVRVSATPWTVACQAPLSMGILQARILDCPNMPNSSFSAGILDHLSKRRNSECSPESWGEGHGHPLTSHITAFPSHRGGLFSRIYTENSQLMFYINRGKDAYVCSQRV